MKRQKKSNRCAFLCGVLSLAAVASAVAAPVDLGSRLEVLWDDHIVDVSKTTAKRTVHRPAYDGVAATFGEKWEGDGSAYFVIVNDADAKGALYRLYYRGSSNALATDVEIPAVGSRICYAESRDGVTWTKPKLNLVAFNGSKANNILLDVEQFGFSWDNFMVFKDTNPNCPADERYKALAGVSTYGRDDFGLWPFVSSDGIHWTRRDRVMWEDHGTFDTLNTAFWDDAGKVYHCYIRYNHVRADGVRVRDVRHCTSKDFKTWSWPHQIVFESGAEDYPLYTNHVQPYPRNPAIYIGLPTRYVERTAWTDTYDKLPGLANRRLRYKSEPRYALALTDCAFMMTRDGESFHREDDAFLLPGPEQPLNWVYGDGYLAYGLYTLPGRIPGTDPELVFHVQMGGWSGKGLTLQRFRLRQDGFVSRHAPYAGAKVVTKPFTFSGDVMRMNFRTSARGGVFVTLRTEDNSKAIHTDEILGNTIDRVVGFRDGKVADFAGKSVVLEFDMRDADLYAFRFGN